MNSKVLFLTLAVAVCLSISDAQSQTCTLLDLGCWGGTCCVRELLKNGVCSSGMRGQACGGKNNCACEEGLTCTDSVCVGPATTTTAVTSTREVTTAEPSPSTEAPTVEPSPSTEAPTPEVTPDDAENTV